MRQEFQREMNEVHQKIIRMGAAVETSIGLACEALMMLDSKRAQDIIDGDHAIDEMEREINQQVVTILALQAPVAGDLRDLAASMKLVTDLERIADHAEDIAEHVIALADLKYNLVLPHDVVRMAEQTRLILRKTLNAFVLRDEAEAATVITMDDIVDKLYYNLKRYYIEQMMLDAKHIPALVELLLLSKHLERAADHAQNVAEWILYFLKGRIMEHDH